ncbi:hypothetical protein C3B55_00590 [Candidatus Pseudomonas adelgestsugas]|uniref:Uncharacterized protein n=1 Tax=Candidatus Pseudomonas adelgestsugas TaxID=1302376 RepID=A0ABX5R8P3_9PSED|nr:hypothetical protein C3B55_00590 [Candidatus Pseudomonas adelgestsugas]
MLTLLRLAVLASSIIMRVAKSRQMTHLLSNITAKIAASLR